MSETAVGNQVPDKGVAKGVPAAAESNITVLNTELAEITKTKGRTALPSSSTKTVALDDKDLEDGEIDDEPRHCLESTNGTSAVGWVDGGATGSPPLDNDDYGMLNVSGGSPPPVTSHISSASNLLHPDKDQYGLDADSYSSYGSYESSDESGGGESSNQRRKSIKKEGRERREQSRTRDDERNGGQEKRKRWDSDKPYKMKLCKFFLKKTCANGEQCTYMHSDFPCKYYYLGMECTLKDGCKFTHGEPLSEQLRNILLKHLETASRKILGNFNRISRENAISLITKRNEELCKLFNVENTWTPINTVASLSDCGRHNVGEGNVEPSPYYHNQHTEQQQQQNQLQPQQHKNIPSLMGMVIDSPSISGNNVPPSGTAQKIEEQRKSDASVGANVAGGTSVVTKLVPPSTAPDAAANQSKPNNMNSKNLTGIISAEHIEKLSQLGITNLEQVNQLTFGQLNHIGLTIAEISEMQINAIKMNKEGMSNAAAAAKSTADIPKNAPENNNTQKDGQDATANHVDSDKDVTVSSNSNINSSSGVIKVDYTQYLKDSNLSFDRSDIYDDDEDEEKLVIDDGNFETEKTPATEYGTHNAEANEEPKYDKYDTPQSRPILPELANALKNPYNQMYVQQELQRDPRQRDPRIYLQLPEQRALGKAKYERATMYDFNGADANANRVDEDKHSLHGVNASVISGSLESTAMEIDGSIDSHPPISYKMYEVDVPRPNYTMLRQNCQSYQSNDPRLRRILDLPEPTMATAELDDSSPKHYTPPSSLVASAEEQMKSTKTNAAADVQPRLDPRLAAANSRNICCTPGGTSSDTKTVSPATSFHLEIPKLLDKSDWYKNLNSRYKILVSQQLALVTTQLRKFYQDSSPNKVFDVSFIVNNTTLQQILSNLGIYIDDNGAVAHVDANNDDAISNENNAPDGMELPNLSQPPPTQPLDFLRAPPPNMAAHLYRAGDMTRPPPQMILSQFGLPLFAPSTYVCARMLDRPTESGTLFNPFGGNNAAELHTSNSNFPAEPNRRSLMGHWPGGGGFGNFTAMPQNLQQGNSNTDTTTGATGSGGSGGSRKQI